MKILTRLVKGLCDLQQAAQEDDFLGRWAARCPRRVEAARTVAQRLQAGADPLPMGTCSVPVDQWPKLEDAYWRGMHDIKAFWTLYVANVIDEIDRKTHDTFDAFAGRLLAHADFPPGVALSTTHPVASAGDAVGRRPPGEWYAPRGQAYVTHLSSKVFDNIDSSRKLAGMTPATYAPNSRSDYLAVGRALTAAAACRQLALLGKSARGDALQVYLHTLLDTRKGEAVIDNHYLRGQTVFPATKDHLVHVDMVTHRWCARLVQQRPNSITTRGDWAACPVQPGRYGDQTNGSSGYKVLAPANGALFGWAVFCTAAEAVLEQIDTQVHASPGNLTRQNAMTNYSLIDTAIDLDQLLKRLPLETRAIARKASEQVNTWLGPLKIATGGKRLADAPDTLLQQVRTHHANTGIELLDFPARWAATRPGYAGVLRLDWNHFDRLGHASLLDLTLIACDGAHYRALPFELEQRCDEEVQILIPSTALGSLRPVDIVEAFQMSAWDSVITGETLHLCGMIPLPGATR